MVVTVARNININNPLKPLLGESYYENISFIMLYSVGTVEVPFGIAEVPIRNVMEVPIGSVEFPIGIVEVPLGGNCGGPPPYMCRNGIWCKEPTILSPREVLTKLLSVPLELVAWISVIS